MTDPITIKIEIEYDMNTDDKIIWKYYRVFLNGRELQEEDAKKDVKKDNRTEKRRKLIDAMEEDRKEKEKLKKEEQKRKQSLKRQCQWAKDQLRGYETAGGIYNLDKDGQRVVMSDKERSKATNKLRTDIKKHCK